MAKSPFLGAAYAARSPNLASQRAINLFAEIVEGPRGTGAEVGGFYSRPGLDLVLSVGPGPIRGMLATDFGLFVVSGNIAYQVTAPYVAASLGNLATSTGPVSLVGNRAQAAMFDGLAGYAWSAGTFSRLSLPFSNPGTAVYQDGFVLVNQLNSILVWQSNLNDLTSWQALNYSTEDGQPDFIVALGELHRQVVVFKEKHTAFWINAGNAGFAFQRLEGVYMERGCLAPASVALTDEVLIWLGRGTDGQGVVYMAKGYSPERISTFAIEYQIAQYATISDAIGFSYQQEGHTFYVLSFPTGNATWVYDYTSSQKFGAPMWYQWTAFSNGGYSRWQANCQAAWQGRVLVGDPVNGNIYALNMDTLTDNGGVKKCLRSWRAVVQDRFQTDKCNFLNIECDTGLQVPAGTNPQLVLRQSFDSVTWGPEIFTSAGRTGQTADIRFNRLGSTRRGLNSDRIFELSTTDQMKIGWLGAEIG